MSGEVNVVALVRGEEQYIFVFDPSRRTELLRLLGRYAADPKLSFNWFDAAVLSQKIREMMPAAVSTLGSPPVSPGSESARSESDGSDLGMIGSDSQATKFHRKPTPRFQIPGS
ncbi:MAG: hypothetical protein MUF23_02225 [Pirellula sp.]|nr:hypothetical protein [Pirellula sp.]